MAFVIGRHTIPFMYGNHVGDWWAWMTITPVFLIVILAFAVYIAFVVYIAVRLGSRGKHN